MNEQILIPMASAPAAPTEFFSNDTLTQPRAQQMTGSNDFAVQIHPTAPFSNAVTPMPSCCEPQIDTNVIQKALNDPKLAPAAMALLDAMGMSSAYQTPVSDPAASYLAEWSSSADSGKQSHRDFSSVSRTAKRRRSSANQFAAVLNDLEGDASALHAPCDENDVPLESIQTPLSPGVSNAMGTLSVISPALSGNSQASPCLSATGFALPPPAEAASKKATDELQKKKVKVMTGKKRSSETSKKSDPSPMTSPQEYLNKLLTERGYSTSKCSSFDTGYHTKPSPLQLASFGTKLIGAIHKPNIELLSSLLSCGLSRNPCNNFGDSIINLVCKRGDARFFQCLMENGCEVRVADEWGRTPLHYAAWAVRPCFDSVQMMLDWDVNLLRVLDKKGMSPLEYVTEDKWRLWLDFIENNKETYWPVGGNDDWKNEVPEIHRPDGTLPDPDDALPVDLAKMVASGDIAPEDVIKMTPEMRKFYKKGSEGLGGWKVEALSQASEMEGGDDAKRKYKPAAHGA